MTPQEKANRIVCEFIGYNRIPCALIVVDEVIETLERLSIELTLNDKNSLKVKFEIMWWNEVKNQIKKL